MPMPLQLRSIYSQHIFTRLDKNNLSLCKNIHISPVSPKVVRDVIKPFVSFDWQAQHPIALFLVLVAVEVL